MVKHALEPEDKQARREAILAAARQLFLADTRRLPAAAAIAQAAGLAKGTLYLYFRSKEEIFTALLLAEWGVLLDEVDTAFWPDGSSPAQHLARFTRIYTGYFARHPQLLRLDAMGYAILEANMAPGPLAAFKQGWLDRLDKAGRIADHALRLDAGRGRHLLLRTCALTRGLWQALDRPPPGPEQGDTGAGTDAPPFAPDFADDLAQALREYWWGALAAPTP